MARRRSPRRGRLDRRLERRPVHRAVRVRGEAAAGERDGRDLSELPVRRPTGRGDEQRRARTARSFDSGSLRELRARPPRLVVIAARTDRYLEGSAFGLARPGGGLSYSPEQKAELWRQGLGSFLRRLTRAGVPVVVVHPVPDLRDRSRRLRRRPCADRTVQRGSAARVRRPAATPVCGRRDCRDRIGQRCVGGELRAGVLQCRDLLEHPRRPGAEPGRGPPERRRRVAADRSLHPADRSACPPGRFRLRALVRA